MRINTGSARQALKSFYSNVYQKIVRYRRGFVWVLCLVVALLVTILYLCRAFDRLELFSLDWRYNMRPVVTSGSNIVFIDMAEDSVAAIGRWPWPRKWHAALIKILNEYHPKAIAFDIVFSEAQDDVDDLALEEALRASGVVYMPVVYDIAPGKLRYYYKGQGVTGIYEPIERFRPLIRGLGHINAIPDPDGILRRVPPLVNFEGRLTSHFGIKIGSDLLDVKDKDIVFYPDSHRIVLKFRDGRSRTIPLDRDNQLIVNWLGPWGKDFKHYSYIDIIQSYAQMKEGKRPLIDLNVFKDKICVIGLTATGLIDIKPIPISSAYPAVGANAMVISSILNDSFMRPVSEGINLFLIIFISAIFTFYQCRLRLLGGMVLAIAGMLSYAAISLAVFILFRLIVVTFYPIFGIFISYLATASFMQIIQSLERARLFKQATRDGLTHLYNIRHFSLLMEAEVKSAAVFKTRPLSILMADIDNFKHINDTYGHQFGDVVLKEVADIIQSKCRQTDVVGRYGGEEFIMMLSGAKARDAAEIGEKIRAAVEAKKFKMGDATHSTTISIGVSEYYGEKTKDELIEKADKALYNAKRTGKNKVCIYSASASGA